MGAATDRGGGAGGARALSAGGVARGALFAIPLFFGLKVASGLALLKVSALALDVGGFTIFSQLLLFAALLNMVAVGGAQNGLVRQAAAAGGDRATIARARAAAFAIWLGAAALIGLPVLLAADRVSDLLVGHDGLDWAVRWLAVLSMAGGPGQILCAILTGRGRAGASLAAQGVGLVAGTGASLLLLSRGDPVAAAFAFAAGPLLTVAAAWLASRRDALPRADRSHLRAEVGALLGYSGAFVAVACFSALTFFGLRYAYREAFGVEQLGFWLVAHRISDTNTQLLGLFMVQVFVPRYTPVAAGPGARAILVRSWLIAAAAMAALLLAFAAAPQLLVRLFLSDLYVPAIGFILAYMAGDVLRVWTSLAMHAAFARARLLLYVGIEIGVVLLFAACTLGLIAIGDPRAPAIAYPLAYGVAAIVATLAFLLAGRRERSGAAAV